MCEICGLCVYLILFEHWAFVWFLCISTICIFFFSVKGGPCPTFSVLLLKVYWHCDTSAFLYLHSLIQHDNSAILTCTNTIIFSISHSCKQSHTHLCVHWLKLLCCTWLLSRFVPLPVQWPSEFYSTQSSSLFSVNEKITVVLFVWSHLSSMNTITLIFYIPWVFM